MKLAEALAQAYPGIRIGPTKAESDVILYADTIAYWNRPEPKPLEADVLAAYNPLIDAKAARIEADRQECRRRLTEFYGDALEQVSRASGLYGATAQSNHASGVEACIAASNAARDTILAATTINEVEAVTVSWPVLT